MLEGKCVSSGGCVSMSDCGKCGTDESGGSMSDRGENREISPLMG